MSDSTGSIVYCLLAHEGRCGLRSHSAVERVLASAPLCAPFLEAATDSHASATNSRRYSSQSVFTHIHHLLLLHYHLFVQGRTSWQKRMCAGQCRSPCSSQQYVATPHREHFFNCTISSVASGTLGGRRSWHRAIGYGPI